MKVSLIHIIFFFSTFSIVNAQCEKDLIELFKTYKTAVAQFKKGTDVFNMKFVQETTYRDGEELKAIKSSIDVISNGIVKYMKTDDSRLCSDDKFQVYIDDKKKSITIGAVVTNNENLASNFNFLDSLTNDNVRITCEESKSKNEKSYWISPKESKSNEEMQKTIINLNADLSKMLKYLVYYGSDNPISKIEMFFNVINFNCLKCSLPENVESIIYTKGKIKEEFKEYSFIDLR